MNEIMRLLNVDPLLLQALREDMPGEDVSTNAVMPCACPGTVDLIAKQDGGIHHHKREASGVWDGCRIRRLTPRECLRLQGWKDERIDLILPLHSDTQLYKQAGNGVTVTVVEAIGKRLAAMDAEWKGGIQ